MIKQIPRKQIRMKQLMLLVVSVFSMFLISCASSKSTTTIANGSDLSKYKDGVFGNGDEGDAELSDILMLVQNDISQRLKVVTPENASNLIREGKGVLSPKISVKTEKWDGGHTYITISFYDYSTNQSVAVVKSSGIGLTISHDQKLAYKALKKELDKTFK